MVLAFGTPVLLVVTCLMSPVITSVLDQSHLTVATIMNPLAKLKGAVVLTPGLIEAECLDILSRSLNFSYDIKVPLSSLEFGQQLDNGSWTGTLGMVERKEVDMCTTFSPPTMAKSSAMDISYFVYLDTMSIVIPYPTSQVDKVWVLTSPLRKEVWICWICSVITVPIVVWLSSGRNLTKGVLSDSFSLFFEMTLSRHANHGNRRSLPYRIICGCILLTAVVLSVAYPAVYTAQLSVPRYRLLANSIEDVASNPDIKVYAISGSSTAKYLEESTNGAQKIVGDLLRKHPERALQRYKVPDDLSRLVKDNNVFLIGTTVATESVRTVREMHGQCRITTAKETFGSFRQCITYPKNSPLTRIIDDKISLMHQIGLLNRILRVSFETENPCPVDSKQAHRQSEKQERPIMLELQDFTGAFLILGTGHSLAVVAFAIQHLYQKINLRRLKVVAD